MLNVYCYQKNIKLEKYYNIFIFNKTNYLNISNGLKQN
mgnify:FL=1